MTVSVTDNFNRSNETPLVNWIHLKPVAVANDRSFNLVSNAAAPQTLGGDHCSVWAGRSFSPDQYSQAACTVTGTTSDRGPGVCVRAHPPHRHYYRAVVSKAVADNVAVSIHRVGFGGEILAVRTVTWVDGDVLLLEIRGTDPPVLKVYQNGVQLGADINSTAPHILEGNPGIAYSSVTTSASVDNWEGGAYSQDEGIIVNTLRPRIFGPGLGR